VKRLLSGTILLAFVIAALAPVALGAGIPMRVSPGRGGIHTNFVLRFSIPDATGTTGSSDVTDAVSVSGPRHAGCVSEADLVLRSAPAHTAVKLALNPAHLHGRWCTGTFTGALIERRTTVCPPGPVRQSIVCPLYVVAPRVLGRFHFTVAGSKKTAEAR
jgi:hypothetical protein